MEEGMIKIDGEELFVDKVEQWGSLPMVHIGGLEFYVAESSETAGEAAREYWQDMAENDPQEFTCIVGTEALVAWALGQNYAPGSIGVNSLEEWLDLHLDVPEEHWAGYDGYELEINDVAEDVADDIGFTPTVAYRWN